MISFHGYLQIILLSNKQVGVRLGLECHLIFFLLLLLSGVHGVGDGDCAVGRTKSILAKEKSSRAGLTEQVVGVDAKRYVSDEICVSSRR